VTGLELAEELEMVRSKIEECAERYFETLKIPLTDSEYREALNYLSTTIAIATRRACEMHFDEYAEYELEAKTSVGSTDIEAYSFMERYPIFCELSLGEQKLALEVKGVHVAVVLGREPRSIKTIEEWKVYEYGSTPE
jgi:hypothetical protein